MRATTCARCRRAFHGWAAAAIAASALLAATALARPSAAGPLTLAECRRLAMERNRALRIASQDVRRAEAGVREATAGYLPAVEARAQATAAEAVSRLQFPDPFSGRTLEAEADLSPDYVLELDATQPIYTFGRLSNRHRQSREALSAARHERERSTDEILYAVEETYYRYLASRDLAVVSEESVTQAEAHARAVRARFETGQASGFDRLRADVRAANLRPGLASSRRARETALLGLKMLLGLPLSDSIEVAGTLEFAPSQITLESALETARQRRPDLAAGRDRIAMADAAVRLARSSDNPQLALQGNYSLYSFDLGNDPFSSERWDDSYQAAVVMQWPLFDGFGTHARVAQARAALEQSRTAREEQEQQVAFEVRQAYLALEEGREVVLSQESNRREAAEALSMAERSYLEGMISSLEVEDAQLALNQAKTNYTTALANYRIAEAEVRRAMGTIAD